MSVLPKYYLVLFSVSIWLQRAHYMHDNTTQQLVSVTVQSFVRATHASLTKTCWSRIPRQWTPVADIRVRASGDVDSCLSRDYQVRSSRLSRADGLTTLWLWFEFNFSHHHTPKSHKPQVRQTMCWKVMLSRVTSLCTRTSLSSQSSSTHLSGITCVRRGRELSYPKTDRAGPYQVNVFSFE